MHCLRRARTDSRTVRASSTYRPTGGRSWSPGDRERRELPVRGIARRQRVGVAENSDSMWRGEAGPAPDPPATWMVATQAPRCDARDGQPASLPSRMSVSRRSAYPESIANAREKRRPLASSELRAWNAHQLNAFLTLAAGHHLHVAFWL